MRAFWLQIRRATTVLLVGLSLGHSPLALACAPAAGMPCCAGSGAQSLGAQRDCTGAVTCVLDCAASLQCACDQPLQSANVSARETPPSGQSVHFLAPGVARAAGRRASDTTAARTAPRSAGRASRPAHLSHHSPPENLTDSSQPTGAHACVWDRLRSRFAEKESLCISIGAV